ncbi:methylmalonyl-CoA mutase family protein [Streptomyces triticiradicis]|uniref:methylmalonyl-CoA mutase family protein n=1 Tax=Streptomyces triticiradicis TaxID=2651189 RepID=UPI001CED50F1
MGGVGAGGFGPSVGLVCGPGDAGVPESDEEAGHAGCVLSRGACPLAGRGRSRAVWPGEGVGSAVEANARYRRLVARGARGVPVGFDLPTLTGRDSDDPLVRGEAGRRGVAVDSVDDMRVLFGGIPLERVFVSMAAGAPAALLLLMYQLAGEEQGVPAGRLTGMVRHDVLEECIVGGTCIFPPEPSLRLAVDLFGYSRAELPGWGVVPVSGWRMAQAGASPAQEVAFTLADGIEYVRAAVAAGMDVDDFASRLSFLFAAPAAVSEGVAKARVARRVWARVLRERFGTGDPASRVLRAGLYRAGMRPAVRQPRVNRTRGRVQGPAALPGGIRLLCADPFGEAVVLPAGKDTRLASRMGRVLRGERDVSTRADPFAGSYAVERLADAMEAAVLELMGEVEGLGGAVAAIGQGFQRDEIGRGAYRLERGRGAGEEHGLAGVGCSRFEEEGRCGPLCADPPVGVRQAERLAKVRAWRCGDRVGQALVAMRGAARGEGNVLYPMKDALAAGATVGEVCGTLREVWGTYVPSGAR